MTGWRLGWLVIPPDLARSVECLAQNLFISPPTLSQYAACAAFDSHDELQANVASYAANRDILLRDLPRVGFDRLAPADGAFYIYADVSDLTADSRALAAQILERAGVAVTPGLDFDPGRGAGTLRFSYARSSADIALGLERLRDLGPWRDGGF